MDDMNVKELAEAGLQAYIDKYCKKCEVCKCSNNCMLNKMLNGELNFFGMEMLITED